MIGKLTLALTGAMEIQVLNIGLQGMLGKPIWTGEAIFFFLTLAGWVVFGIFDTLRYCRSLGSNEMGVNRGDSK